MDEQNFGIAVSIFALSNPIMMIILKLKGLIKIRHVLYPFILPFFYTGCLFLLPLFTEVDGMAMVLFMGVAGWFWIVAVVISWAVMLWSIHASRRNQKIERLPFERAFIALANYLVDRYRSAQFSFWGQT